MFQLGYFAHFSCTKVKFLMEMIFRPSVKKVIIFRVGKTPKIAFFKLSWISYQFFYFPLSRLSIFFFIKSKIKGASWTWLAIEWSINQWLLPFFAGSKTATDCRPFGLEQLIIFENKGKFCSMQSHIENQRRGKLRKQFFLVLCCKINVPHRLMALAFKFSPYRESWKKQKTGTLIDFSPSTEKLHELRLKHKFHACRASDD